MPFKWSNASRERLDTCHEDLVTLFDAVIVDPDLTLDLTILQGIRTIEQQKKNVANGASQTMRSRHLLKPSLAVDVAPFVDGGISWHWPQYHTIAPVIKAAAKRLNIEIEWGGDWTSFKDGPHWQLPRKVTEAEWAALGV